MNALLKLNTLLSLTVFTCYRHIIIVIQDLLLNYFINTNLKKFNKYDLKDVQFMRQWKTHLLVVTRVNCLMIQVIYD